MVAGVCAASIASKILLLYWQVLRIKQRISSFIVDASGGTSKPCNGDQGLHRESIIDQRSVNKGPDLKLDLFPAENSPYSVVAFLEVLAIS
jgi:hypothetical protein